MSPLFRVLDPVADLVNPGLAIAAIFAATLDWRARRDWLIRALPTALGVAGIYLIMAVDHLILLWQRYGGDYSTHVAFATTLSLSLVIWRRQWSVVLILVWVLYLGLVVMIGYHTFTDVIAAALVACLVTIPCHVAAHVFEMRRAARIS